MGRNGKEFSLKEQLGADKVVFKRIFKYKQKSSSLKSFSYKPGRLSNRNETDLVPISPERACQESRCVEQLFSLGLGMASSFSETQQRALPNSPSLERSAAAASGEQWYSW